MDNVAIASCRVSTPEQKMNNSLTRQEQSVRAKALELESEIIKIWSDDVSSKSGTNLNRRDLKEMLEFCDQNKRVKYLIVDEVDRFMRCIDEFYWYVVEFRRKGVEVVFASQDINDNSLTSKVQKLLYVLRGEMSNDERVGKTLTGMKNKVASGYYPFSVPQGYKKTATPGLFEPEGQVSTLLQKAMKDIAYGRKNKYEALEELHKSGYRLRSGKPLRADKFTRMLLDDYYAGLVSVSNWGEKYQGIKGLHQGLITPEEHEMIKTYMSRRRTRLVRKHNPEFPMANLMQDECGGRFTGLMQGNGKGKFYPKI